MEQKEDLWSDISFVKSSNYRPDILRIISKNPVTISQICESTGYDIYYISKIVKELNERNLVKCLDESKSKDRYFRITKRGVSILSKIKKLSFNQFGEGELKFDENKLFDAVNDTGKIDELIHNFFPYPARFPPSIPRFFINELTSEGGTVLDPFCGGGTTLLESSILGRKGIGIDLNKLGTFLTEVKTTPLKENVLRDYLLKIKNKINNKQKINDTLFSEKDKEVISISNRKKISQIKNIIDRFPKEIKKFFTCCLISSCNIFSNKRDIEKDILHIFLRKCDQFIPAIAKFFQLKKSDILVYHEDSRNILRYLEPNSVDLIVTSPSYPDVHMEYNNLMLESRRGSKLFYNLIDYKEERSASDYRMSSGDKYFENLDSILQEVLKTLKEGRRFVLIIGLKNKEYLKKLKKVFSKNNMYLLNEYVRSVPNRQWYNQINPLSRKGIPFEYILIYEKRSSKNNEWRNIQTEFRKGFGEETLHEIHPYPGSFIYKIPEKLIAKHCINRGDELILDNFMGCGTTLLEAIKAGKRSVGTDFNPLAYLLSKVKTTKIDLKFLDHEINKITNFIIENIYKKDKSLSLIPDFPNKNEWYAPKTLYQLGIVNKYISSMKNKNVQDFFKVAFSNTVVECSGTTYNFITDNMRPTKQKEFPVQQVFLSNLNKIYKSYFEFYSKLEYFPECKVIFGDARNLPLENETADLAITSPPYVNGLDYLKMHRLTYYWLGIPFEEKLKDEIGARSKRGREDCILEYRKAMKKCFEEVYRVLKNGTYYYLIIGDTLWRNKSLQTNKVLAEIGKEVGFNFIEEIEMTLPGHFYKDHAKDVEWMLVFQK